MAFYIKWISHLEFSFTLDKYLFHCILRLINIVPLSSCEAPQESAVHKPIQKYMKTFPLSSPWFRSPFKLKIQSAGKYWGSHHTFFRERHKKLTFFRVRSSLSAFLWQVVGSVVWLNHTTEPTTTMYFNWLHWSTKVWSMRKNVCFWCIFGRWIRMFPEFLYHPHLLRCIRLCDRTRLHMWVTCGL